MPPESNESTTRILVGPNDAVPEILSRLRAGRSASAIITIPASSSLFLTASEFRALKATAEQARRILTIETDDRLRKQLAEVFGLPVVDIENGPRPIPDKTSVVNLETGRGVLESSEEPTSDPNAVGRPKRERPPKSKRPLGTGKIVAIGGGVALLVIAAALVAAYVLQTATVEITTKRTPVTADVIFAVIQPGAARAAGSVFTIQASPTKFDVPFTATIPTTGRARSAGVTAAGTLELRNTSDQPVTIAAGTAFTSFDGVDYFFTSNVTVPQFNKTSKAAGQAQGVISASAGGTSGNKDVGVLTGKLDSGIYYSNRGNVIQGGADSGKQGVAQADIDKLVAQANQQIPALAKSTKAGGGLSILPGSLQTGTLAFTTDHKVGDQSGSITITASMPVTALAYSATDLQTQASSALQSSLSSIVPNGSELVANSVTLGEPVQVNTQGQSMQFKVTGIAQARASINAARANQIAKMIAGKSVSEASAFLGTLPEVQSVSISSSPGFLPRRIPGSADRITVASK